MAPKTQLLFQAKQTEIDYKRILLTNQDSTETRYYVGATWDATALTSGIQWICCWRFQKS